MNYLLTILITLSAITAGLSQNQRAERKAQLDALKVKYFTEELDLSEKESEAFWPVFYQFEKEQKAVKKAIRAKSESLENSKPSEQEFLNTLSEIEKLQSSLASNKTKLIKDCIPILGLEKAVKMVSLEDKLRKRMSERIKNRMEK